MTWVRVYLRLVVVICDNIWEKNENGVLTSVLLRNWCRRRFFCETMVLTRTGVVGFWRVARGTLTAKLAKFRRLRRLNFAYFAMRSTWLRAVRTQFPPRTIAHDNCSWRRERGCVGSCRRESYSFYFHRFGVR